MIKISYTRLVRIALTMGYTNRGDAKLLVRFLNANNITASARYRSHFTVDYMFTLDFSTPEHETLFKLKYSEYI